MTDASHETFTSTLSDAPDILWALTPWSRRRVTGQRAPRGLWHGGRGRSSPGVGLPARASHGFPSSVCHHAGTAAVGPCGIVIEPSRIPGENRATCPGTARAGSGPVAALRKCQSGLPAWQSCHLCLPAIRHEDLGGGDGGIGVDIMRREAIMDCCIGRANQPRGWTCSENSLPRGRLFLRRHRARVEHARG